MRSNANPKRPWVLALWLAVLVTGVIGCNLPISSFQALIAPSAQEGSPTPNWSATLEAAAPPTEIPDAGVEAPLQVETELQVPPPPTPTPIKTGPILYYTQAGDTLNALAVRFGVAT